MFEIQLTYMWIVLSLEYIFAAGLTVMHYR